MKMKNIIFCFFIIVILVGCQKANSSDDTSVQSQPDIFPDKVGDTWTYLVNDTTYTFSSSATISQYNLTISIVDSVLLPGALKANRWVYSYPGGTDTNYVYQHGDTISFAAYTSSSLLIVRQYIIPLRLYSSWQYVESNFTGPLHYVTVDSVSTIFIGGDRFENAYAIHGVPGVPDNFFYVEEWIADHVGVVKRYINNRGYTIGPDQHKTSWSLVNYHLE
jgi:hypothetical protein